MKTMSIMNDIKAMAQQNHDLKKKVRKLTAENAKYQEAIMTCCGPCDKAVVALKQEVQGE